MARSDKGMVNRAEEKREFSEQVERGEAPLFDDLRGKSERQNGYNGVLCGVRGPILAAFFLAFSDGKYHFAS